MNEWYEEWLNEELADGEEPSGVMTTDGRYWMELHPKDEIVRNMGQPDEHRVLVNRLCVWYGEDGTHGWLTSVTADELVEMLRETGKIV